MSRNPDANREDAIATACHNAIHAIHGEAKAALSEQRSFDDRLALAAALEAINNEVHDGHFLLPDLIKHLRRTAAPRRQA